MLKKQHGRPKACSCKQHLSSGPKAFRRTARSAFTGSMASPKAQLIRPDVAYCVAGKVNNADKLYLVIESVRPDTKRPRRSAVPTPADGAGGSSIG
jgi:hypothetical protein